MRSPDLSELMERALSLIEAGRHNAAAETCLEIAKHHPQDAGDWARRAADCYRRAGKHQQEIESLSMSAEAFQRQGQTVKAIAVCRAILTIDPRHTTTQERLAGLHAETSKRAVPPTVPAWASMSAKTGNVGVPPVRSSAPPGRISVRPGKITVPPVDAAAPIADMPLRLMVPGSTKHVETDEDEPGAYVIPLDELEFVELDESSPPPVQNSAEAPPAAPDSDGLTPFDGMLCPDDLTPFGSVPAPDDLTPPFGSALALDGLTPSGANADGSLEMVGVPQNARDILPRTALFSDLSAGSLRRLIDRAELRHFAPGKTVCRQGQFGEELFVIVDGLVEVSLERPHTVLLGTLGEGEFFGEIALVTGGARSATVRAVESTHLLAIGRTAIGELIDHEPAVLIVVLRFLRERLLAQLVARNPLFEPFADHPTAARLLEIDLGNTLIRQGEEAKGVFILMAGEAQALRCDEHGETSVGDLGPGDLCGEMSLLSGTPAAATVRAATKCMALFLAAQDFREMMMAHPHLYELVSSLAEQRRAKNEAIASGRQRYAEDRLPIV